MLSKEIIVASKVYTKHNIYRQSRDFLRVSSDDSFAYLEFLKSLVLDKNTFSARVTVL